MHGLIFFETVRGPLQYLTIEIFEIFDLDTLQISLIENPASKEKIVQF